MTRSLRTTIVAVAALASTGSAQAQPVMENLGRGVVVVRTGEASAYIGWRLLGTDPAGVAFNVYRAAAAGRATK